jgi:hypothetical protein
MDNRLKTPWRGLDNDFQLGNVDRGSALWYQVAVPVRIRLETMANSVHEVGPGRGLNGILLKHIGFEYSTLSDLPSQQGLEAPLLQSATETEVADIVCAYQMLEHNSLRSFGELMGKLRGLSRRFVIISLPVANPYFRMEIEPKLFSGYAITSRTRIALTFFFPRWLFPRPKSTRIRSITRSTALASTVDEQGNEVLASRSHLWEVGERGAKLKDLVLMAEAQSLQLRRISHAPFFPKQVFLEFEKS